MASGTYSPSDFGSLSPELSLICSEFVSNWVYLDPGSSKSMVFPGLLLFRFENNIKRQNFCKEKNLQF